MPKLSFESQENIVADDLIWLFCHSEAAIGISSNWGAMVSASCFGSSDLFHDNTTNFQLKSVARRRKLEKILHKLPSDIQNILYASFADIQINQAIVRMFKKLAGTACITPLASPKLLAEACSRISVGKDKKGDKQLTSQIRILAQQNYITAITTFMKAKFELSKQENHDRSH